MYIEIVTKLFSEVQPLNFSLCHFALVEIQVQKEKERAEKEKERADNAESLVQKYQNKFGKLE